MLTQQKLIVSLALVLFTATAGAGPVVYVITGNQQFGTIDIVTGAFHQIGPDTPDGQGGLVQAPNGSLFSLTFSSNLESINPATGITSIIGPTGLAACEAVDGTCGPNSANGLGGLDGKLYATDFGNNLYTVNAATGAASLIGPTGVPGVPAGFPDFTGIPFKVFDEGLSGVGGMLYATFNAFTFDPATRTIVTTVVPPYLYQIDPSTGKTTRVAPTLPALSATVDVNGTFYAFKANTRQLLTLDLSNGNTRFVTNIDPAAGLIVGAAPAVPEPASVALAGIGIAAIVALKRRRRRFRVREI